jgi:hypothetical protein
VSEPTPSPAEPAAEPAADPAAAPDLAAKARPRPRIRIRRLVIAALLPLAVIAVAMLVNDQRQTWRVTQRYDPPVLAGQLAMPWCTGGFYARKGDEVVLTIAAHCGSEGQPVTRYDGASLGVLGPRAALAECMYADKVCLASDMMYVRLDRVNIPWGHLNEVDLGAGGYHVLAPGTQPLSCDTIPNGGNAELDGRNHYRSGRVIEKGPNYNDSDPNYFPCIVAAEIRVQAGDSGGAVLVDGMPAGITSRVFSGYVGFTPLAEGLDALGLQLCTDPDCGLTPPG